MSTHYPRADDSPFRADAWQHQDGQITHEGAHPQDRWDERCPDGWEDFPVRSAWAAGVDVNWSHDEQAARVHVPSGMLVISQLGFLATVVPAREKGFDVEEVADRER